MKIAPLIGQGDYSAALRILENELNKTPEKIPYLEMIAQCQWQSGNEEKAIETAKKALALDPMNFEMPRMLSQIFAEHEDHEQAVQYVKVGLSNFPSEPFPPPPSFLFSALKLAGKLSARWKRVQEAAEQDLRDPGKDSREWQSWANEYLEWHEETVKD